MNRTKRSLYLRGYKYDEFLLLIKQEEFCENVKMAINAYNSANAQNFTFDKD